MKMVHFNIVTILILFDCFNTSVAQYSKDSCNLIAKNRYSAEMGSIQLGEIFTSYEIPYLNDHTIIYNAKDKKWHLYGIISPQTNFIHLIADSLTQKGWVKEKPFSDGAVEIWAPHIIFHNNLYHMFYTKIGIPREIHHVVSRDLFNWSKSEKPVLALKNELTENMKNKDPMVFRDEANKQWIMYYSMMKDDKHWVVGYSTSDNLNNWSDPKICFDENTDMPGVESPFVVKRGEYYYLFLSARPWPVGGEDIFRSKSPFLWKIKDLVRRINPWHAAEVIQDLDGQWYLTLSSGTQCKDFRMAPLYWNDIIKD
ncbi:family 43 glycosylhydrolase [Maribellus comscasis]|nr:family 43 glycosylhydrolase [Maribellus comscasis]